MVKKYHGGNLKEAARTYGLKEEEFVDFSANINPLGPSPHVWDALNTALPKIVHYPCPEGKELKAGLASHLGVPIQQLVLGNGGAELIYLLSRFFSPGRIIVTAPTFGEYGQGILNPQVFKVRLNPEMDFRLELDVFQKVVQRGDLIFIGNPNNPTGVVTQRHTILQLAALAAERGAVLVIDEAFMDFVQDSQSVVKDIVNYRELIVVGSLTKIFALPGLRLGYLVAQEDLVGELEQVLPPWRVNSLAQAAGTAALADKNHLTASKRVIAEERKFLADSLQNLGFKVFPGKANFLLLNGRSLGMTGEALQSYLGPRGVLIRLCHSFDNLDEYYIRIAVRSRQENEKLIGLIKEALSSQGGWRDAGNIRTAWTNGVE